MERGATIVTGAALVALLASACGARSALEDRVPPRGDVDAARPIDAARPVDAPIASDAPIAIDAGCGVGWDETISATLRMTADDHYRLFVHGVLVDDTPRHWGEVQTYSLRLFVHPARRNSIGIEGTNVAEVDGRDRGVIAVLAIDGGMTMFSDARWRLSTSPPPGWTDDAFDAGGWGVATMEGADGIGPWGFLLGDGRASWLWSYDSDLPASAKPLAETIALRRDFYFDTYGMISDAPTPCP